MTRQKNGIELIAAERQRQLSVEGWTPEHDDTHDLSEMADAAACYAMTRRARLEVGIDDIWRWEQRSWKPSSDGVHPISGRIRDLEKAGALIAAEIDRLLRLKAGKASGADSVSEGGSSDASSSREAEIPAHNASLVSAGKPPDLDDKTPVTHPSITLAGQMWPEDAFAAWKREHHSKGDTECPDSDAEHCAFMSGIAYAEEVQLELGAGNKRETDSQESGKVSGEPDAPSDNVNAVLQKARELLADIEASHSDPESSNYNECDKDPCRWCEDARRLLSSHSNAAGVPEPDLGEHGAAIPTNATTQKDSTASFIEMPSGLAFHNACNEPCDMLVGPCVCGAWHRLEDLPYRVFNQLRAERWRKTSDGVPDQGNGHVVAVVNYGTFYQPSVPDEWQDVRKRPKQYPYWLPLPPLPESASRLPLETEGCSRSDRAVALSAEEPPADFGIDEP